MIISKEDFQFFTFVSGFFQKEFYAIESLIESFPYKETHKLNIIDKSRALEKLVNLGNEKIYYSDRHYFYKPTIDFDRNQFLNLVSNNKQFVNLLESSEFDGHPEGIDNLLKNDSTSKFAVILDSDISFKNSNYLYDLDATKPIDKVIWGYRQKPTGIPSNHAGDIFVFFKDKETIGISLKAGTAKSKEPLKNTYVGTQYRNLGKDLKTLEDALWDGVYSKIPNINSIATKENYIANKNNVTKLYVNYYLENETEANVLYTEMLKITRTHFCDIINNLTNDEFKEWVQTTFNLQKKGETVPLIMVKAVGSTAEQKGDDVVDVLPLVTKHYAYLNTKSVQEYLIDIHTSDDKKTLKMTIRSDSGVRAEKKPGKQGRLGQYTMLKMLYSGVV